MEKPKELMESGSYIIVNLTYSTEYISLCEWYFLKLSMR